MTGATVGRRAACIGAAFVAGTLIGCTTPGGGVATDTARDLGPTSQLVTGYIGQQMTEEDRARVRLALDNNSNNQSTAWQGGPAHTPYKVTPIRTFNEAGGVRCRDFDTQATIDGRHQRIRSTACRQSDGAWRPLAD
jgi:surface antigen